MDNLVTARFKLMLNHGRFYSTLCQIYPWVSHHSVPQANRELVVADVASSSTGGICLRSNANIVLTTGYCAESLASTKLVIFTPHTLFTLVLLTTYLHLVRFGSYWNKSLFSALIWIVQLFGVLWSGKQLVLWVIIPCCSRDSPHNLGASRTVTLRPGEA